MLLREAVRKRPVFDSFYAVWYDKVCDTIASGECTLADCGHIIRDDDGVVVSCVFLQNTLFNFKIIHFVYGLILLYGTCRFFACSLLLFFGLVGHPFVNLVNVFVVVII